MTDGDRTSRTPPLPVPDRDLSPSRLSLAGTVTPPVFSVGLSTSTVQRCGSGVGRWGPV